METDRRTILAGLASLMPALAASPPALAAARTVVGGAIRHGDGSYAAVLYDLDQGLLREVAMPGRGHDLAINPVTGVCVVFARRPGKFAIAFGSYQGGEPIGFATPAGHHFYGHGVFSHDGRLLYTTENALETGEGVIGIWSVKDGYKRVGSFPSFGIGPHDLNLVHGGRTLVIANGGIATHPDTGRRPLNLATMEPSLCYVDARSGALVEQHFLPAALHRNSIRHLDVARNGTVVFGCQFKGPRTQQPSLIGVHRMGNELDLIPDGVASSRALRGYVSSISVDRSGTLAAVTSSRGEAVLFVDIAGRRIVGKKAFPDASGVAAEGVAERFIATGGGGDVAELTPHGGGSRRGRTDWAWDNHLVAVRLPQKF
jgi:uncharacterized protein